MPKERPKVNIGQVIRSYRGDRGLSQGDIERRTGLLRCYLSRVENGHTVPSLETLAKIGEAMEISLADFFPGGDSAQDLQTRKVLSELSKEEIIFLTEIKKCSTTLSDDDKKLVLGMIRKMATVVPPPRNPKSVTAAGARRIENGEVDVLVGGGLEWLANTCHIWSENGIGMQKLANSLCR